jgi:tetratricopeptide (TPR) repeat protein
VKRPILLALICLLPAAGQTGWEQDQSAGKAMFEQRRFEEAEHLFRQALVKAHEFGREDPRFATSLKDLAGLYRVQGRFAEAEPLLRLAIEVMERDGREHPELAADLELLARIYLAQMKLSEAELTFKRELALLERKHGAEALEIVPALNSLARVIQIVTKRAGEARDLLLRVIAIREAKQGPEHPDVALDLIRLGRLCAVLKEFGDAEAAYRRALAIQEKAFGPDHLTLAGTLDALGGLFRDQERWSDAEPFFRRSLALRQGAYGPLHAEVGPALDNLAGVLFRQKRFAEAEPLYDRALFVWTAALGEQHPLVAGAHDFMAMTLAFQGKYAAAEPHYRRGLDIREAHILRSLNNAALVAVAQEKLKDAEPLYKVALSLLERARETPADSDVYAQTLANYADLLGRAGRKAQAAKLDASAKRLQKEPAAKERE